MVTTIAGIGQTGYAGDGGPATQARLSDSKIALVGPDGGIYIDDMGNDVIRRIDPVTGNIETWAGQKGVLGGADGIDARQSGFSPRNIVFDIDNDLIVADRDGNKIRSVDWETRIISTIAGSGVTGPRRRRRAGPRGGAQRPPGPRRGLDGQRLHRRQREQPGPEGGHRDGHHDHGGRLTHQPTGPEGRHRRRGPAGQPPPRHLRRRREPLHHRHRQQPDPYHRQLHPAQPARPPRRHRPRHPRPRPSRPFPSSPTRFPTAPPPSRLRPVRATGCWGPTAASTPSATPRATVTLRRPQAGPSRPPTSSPPLRARATGSSTDRARLHPRRRLRPRQRRAGPPGRGRDGDEPVGHPDRAGATGSSPPRAGSWPSATPATSATWPARSSTARCSTPSPPRRARATTWWPPTAASSPSATPASSAPWAARRSTPRCSRWCPTATGRATGWWPPTAACSPSTPPSGAPWAATRLNKPVTGMVPFGNGYLMVGPGRRHLQLLRPALLRLARRPAPRRPIVAVAALAIG